MYGIRQCRYIRFYIILTVLSTGDDSVVDRACEVVKGLGSQSGGMGTDIAC